MSDLDFLKTTEKKGHWHVLYSNGQQAFCSVDEGHSHAVLPDGTLVRANKHTHVVSDISRLLQCFFCRWHQFGHF